MTVFRLGELYCGPGGLACGAGMAYSWDGRHRIEHAWASDYDADTCKTYARNICHGNASTVYCEDVRQLDLKKLGKIDAFAYGFPCNSFSNSAFSLLVQCANRIQKESPVQLGALAVVQAFLCVNESPKKCVAKPNFNLNGIGMIVRFAVLLFDLRVCLE